MQAPVGAADKCRQQQRHDSSQLAFGQRMDRVVAGDIVPQDRGHGIGFAVDDLVEEAAGEVVAEVADPWTVRQVIEVDESSNRAVMNEDVADVAVAVGQLGGRSVSAAQSRSCSGSTRTRNSFGSFS